MNDPRSIALVRLSALGDVLMFVPLVRALQAAFPQAKLTWIISPFAYEMVAGLDGVEFMVLDKPSSIRDYYRFYKQLKHRQFDVLLAAQASFRANLLYPLINARRKIGYDALRAKDGHGWFVNERITPGREHTLESFLKFAKALGVEQPEVRWDLPLEASAVEWALARLPQEKSYLVINPAASQAERNWVLARYCEIAKIAPERWGVQVVLTGGPGAYERQLANEILKHAPGCVDLVGETKPRQLLAVIARAKGVLTPDTGPSHMAASVGTPVVALHAVTSAKVSGPYPFLHLAIDHYEQAHREILQQSMADHVWGTHIHGEETMALIPLEAVIARLDEVLESESSR